MTRIMHPLNKVPRLTKYLPFTMFARYGVRCMVDLEKQELLAGDGILVGPDQYQDVHAAYATACRATGFESNAPDLFVYAGGIGASTLGFAGGTSFVKVAHSLVESFSTAELTFVLAHELGHLAFSHSVSRSVVDDLLEYGHETYLPHILTLLGTVDSRLKLIIGVVGIVRLLTMRRLSRMDEYSADRAGLLAVRQTCKSGLRGRPPREVWVALGTLVQILELNHQTLRYVDVGARACGFAWTRKVSQGGYVRAARTAKRESHTRLPKILRSSFWSLLSRVILCCVCMQFITHTKQMSDVGTSYNSFSESYPVPCPVRAVRCVCVYGETDGAHMMIQPSSCFSYNS